MFGSIRKDRPEHMPAGTVLAEGVLGLEASSTIGLGNAANRAHPIGTGTFEIVNWIHSKCERLQQTMILADQSNRILL